MEGRFGTIARWAVALAGLSGLWMLRNNDLWYRFAMPAFWWMWAMAGLWLVFAFVLFVAEPLWLHAAFRRRTLAAPEATFEIGRASCRERVCQYVLISVGAVSLKKKRQTLRVTLTRPETHYLVRQQI